MLPQINLDLSHHILLGIACLMAISTPAFAQLPAPKATEASAIASITCAVLEPTRLAQDLAGYAPLDNVPFYPGGQRALEDYLRDLSLYPDQTRIRQRKGAVQVQFRVMSSGKLTEIRIIQSVEIMLNQAILRAVSLMPGGTRPTARAWRLPAFSRCLLHFGSTRLYARGLESTGIEYGIE